MLKRFYVGNMAKHPHVKFEHSRSMHYKDMEILILLQELLIILVFMVVYHYILLKKILLGLIMM